MQVKIIEKDLAKSEGLCEALPEATIIHGDGSDNELLIEEGIGDADALLHLREWMKRISSWHFCKQQEFQDCGESQ